MRATIAKRKHLSIPAMAALGYATALGTCTTFHVSLVGAAQPPSDARHCERTPCRATNWRDIVRAEARRKRHQPFWALLTGNGKADQLMGYVASILPDQYAKPAHVSSGVSIGEHTGDVVRNFERFSGLYRLGDLQKRLGPEVRLKETLKAALLFHDYGKHLEWLRFKPPHSHTIPLMVSGLSLLGFRSKEIRLAQYVVDPDILGDVARARASVPASESLIRDRAASLGIHSKELMRILLLVNAADGGAHPDLRAHAFWQPGRVKLVPTHPAIDRLADRLGVALPLPRTVVAPSDAAQAGRQAKRLIRRLKGMVTRRIGSSGFESFEQLKWLLAQVSDPTARGIVDSVISGSGVVRVMLPSNYRDSVAKHGIVSLHRSRKTTSPFPADEILHTRAYIEANYLGLPRGKYDQLDSDTKSKYGAIDLTRFPTPVLEPNPYGDDAYLIPINSVARRMTITLGDSARRLFDGRPSGYVRPVSYDDLYLPWSHGKYFLAAKMLFDYAYLGAPSGLVMPFLSHEQLSGFHKFPEARWTDPIMTEIVRRFRVNAAVPGFGSHVEGQMFGPLPLSIAHTLEYTEMPPGSDFARALDRNGVISRAKEPTR